MDRLFAITGMFGIFILSWHAAATPRPDPDLVAALDAPSPPTKAIGRASTQAAAVDDSTSTALTYPAGTLPLEHARALSTESTLSYSYGPMFHEKHFSFVVPSVVVHGFPIDKEVADQMPNKVDGGQTVITPGAGLEYVSKGGFLVLGGVLKDCYNDLAGLVQIGQQFKIGQRTSIGYSAGIYSRETPITCSTTTNRRGRATVTCDEFDSYRLKWTTQVNGESVDLIPMPFLHFTTAVYRSDDLELDFKILSNFALNEFGFAVPF